MLSKLRQSICTVTKFSLQQKASEIFFVGVKRRQRFTAVRLLIVVRVIKSPARHRYLSVNLGGSLVATLPRPVARLANHTVNLLLVWLGRLLPRLPHQLFYVSTADAADTTAIPVGSRWRCTPSIPVWVVVSPLSPAKLQSTQQYINLFASKNTWSAREKKRMAQKLTPSKSNNKLLITDISCHIITTLTILKICSIITWALSQWLVKYGLGILRFGCL